MPLRSPHQRRCYQAYPAQRRTDSKSAASADWATPPGSEVSIATTLFALSPQRTPGSVMDQGRGFLGEPGSIWRPGWIWHPRGAGQ